MLRDGPPLRAASLMQLLGPLRHARMQGAEIGVLNGTTSQHLLFHFSELFLWMVDSWSACTTESTYFNSQDGVARLTQENHLANLEQAYARTAFAGERRALVRADSQTAAKGLADQSLDFVFIDAEHTYDAVRRDILSWWPKIRPGGLLCGHDYGGRRNRRGFWGVNRAVDEFVAALGLELKLAAGQVWWVARPPFSSSGPARSVEFPIVRVVYGNSAANEQLQKEIRSAFRAMWAREEVAHLVAGRDNARQLRDAGAKRVELVVPEPTLPDSEKFGPWYMKTYLIAKAMELYPEVLYLDFDCRVRKQPDGEMQLKLRSAGGPRFGGSLLGGNVRYRRPVCLTIHRDRRLHPIRRCLGGGILYFRDRQWIQSWLSAYEEIGRRGISLAGINDESVLMHVIDGKCGVLDAAEMVEEFEIPIAVSRRSTPEAKQRKDPSDAYFYHR